MDIFKAGKNFELAALGEINKKKEIDLSRQIIRDDLLQRSYPNYSKEAIEKFFNKNPEERRFFDKKLEKEIIYRFAKNREVYTFNLETSLKIVEQCQPRQLEPLADDLYNKIGEELGIEERDENDDFIDLKFYTAVNSKADYSFGIDAFVVYYHTNEESGEKEKITVSLDVTVNSLKDRKKADLILYFQEDSADKRENWIKDVSNYAKIIKEKLKEKIENKKNEKV